jgi:hypothetical protein
MTIQKREESNETMAYSIFITSIFLAAVVLGMALIRPHLKESRNRGNLKNYGASRGRSQMKAGEAYVVIE